MDKGLNAVVKTGTVLDEIMEGIEKGIVTTIFGFPGSGKTTLCMEVSSRFLDFGKVMYVDTERGFSPRRLRQISEKDHSNLLIFEPETWEEQGKVVEKAREIKPSLLVVDSVISLFKLEDLGSRDLARHFKSLSSIAKDLEIPVLLTNQAYEWEGKTGMVNKTISEYWSKAVVFIEKADKPGMRRLVLRKHLWLPEGREVLAEITEKGFRKRKFGFF